MAVTLTSIGIFLEWRKEWMEACEQALKVIKSAPSLYKEDINTAYLREAKTDACSTGMMH